MNELEKLLSLVDAEIIDCNNSIAHYDKTINEAHIRKEVVIHEKSKLERIQDRIKKVIDKQGDFQELP